MSKCYASYFLLLQIPLFQLYPEFERHLVWDTLKPRESELKLAFTGDPMCWKWTKTSTYWWPTVLNWGAQQEIDAKKNKDQSFLEFSFKQEEKIHVPKI